MMEKLVTPVILAGGVGTRLWPLSREANPKQFCYLGFGNTLFQDSLLRVHNKMLFAKPIVVCARKHVTTVKMQADEIGIELGQIIAEPVARNTAAAIALAANSPLIPDPGLMLVLPSDHRIGDMSKFDADVISARLTALELERLVLFGVKPTAVETGYGYIRAGSSLQLSGCSEISEFIEKPNKSQVEILVQDPDVYWNSGMFFGRKSVFKRELDIFVPEVSDAVYQATRELNTSDFVLNPELEQFSSNPSISFDIAVIEKTQNIAICPLLATWSDLGSWKAIWENSSVDSSGNSCSLGVVDSGSKGCLVSTDGPVVGTCGLEDIVVVANRDAVLVCHKEHTQGVKNIVEKLQETNPNLIETHCAENRPWGRFESVDRGESHQVKRITVEPGGRLSLQYHYHRSEHWIVVEGIATVTIDGDVKTLSPCQQVFIPQGAVHRLENLTDEPVTLIEVQYGGYLGEDDIVRVEDAYGRPEFETPNVQSKAA